MATQQDIYTAEAKKKKGEKTMAELGKEAAESRAGRRAMYAAGGEKLYQAGEEKARKAEESVDAIRGAGQRGTAAALAAKGPSADLRALSGAATEAERAGEIAVAGAAEKAAGARQEAAASMMDVAVGLEEMGTEVEDYSAKRKELTAGMNAIIDKHKGFWNDDEEAMHTEILAMVDDPTIPEDLKQEFIDKANQIYDPDSISGAGSWDV